MADEEIRELVLRNRRVIYQATPKKARRTLRQDTTPKQNVNSPRPIPAVRVTSETIKKHVQECGICMEKMKVARKSKRPNDSHPMSTPCGHVFCRKCILQCLKQRAECPNCKKIICCEKQMRLMNIDTSKEVKCPLCGGKEKLHSTPCGHIICAECFATKFKKRCPTCKIYVARNSFVRPVYY